jgi:hypothetical protein
MGQRGALKQRIVPMINLFNELGKLSTDTIDPLEVENLPEAERTAMFECIAASKEAEAGEDRLIAARKSVHELMRTYDEALAADNLANPPITAQAAHAAVIAANLPGYVPKKIKADTKTRAALAKVSDDLATARIEFIQSEAASRLLSEKRGNKFLAFMNSKEPITAESVHRENIAREQARKLAIAKGEIEAPKSNEPIRQHQIDRVMSGSSRERGNRRPVYPSRV